MEVCRKKDFGKLQQKMIWFQSIVADHHPLNPATQKGTASMESFSEMLQPLVTDLQMVLAPYRDKILFAYLFGSIATGEAAHGSDVDLAIYLTDSDPQCQRALRIDLYMALSRRLKKNDIDIVILNTATNLVLLDEIIRRGIVILDFDPPLREEFETRRLHQAMDFRGMRKAVMGA